MSLIAVFRGGLMKVLERLQVFKTPPHWVVFDPSGLCLWAGLVWVDAIGFETGRKQ